MNILKDIYTGPAARRPHRVIGAAALLVAWSFFGTVHQVMHLGSFLEMLFILAGTDTALCMFLWARRQTRRISSAVNSAKPENDKDEMEKAA